MATKKKEAKPLYKSLTVQSAVAFAVLLLAKVLLPVFTKYEVPDSVFESLCALLGVSGTIGLRRALPVLIIACLPFALTQPGCGPSKCEKVSIEITDHPKLKSPPAGKVTVKCDGKEKAVVTGKEIKK